VIALIVIFQPELRKIFERAAGMGLAEKCDALVIVVSEERGRISGFKDGTMNPLDDRQQIIDVITEHWQEAAGKIEMVKT
jgi:DNA integrity scanning protein DisA with diadenylate cyclase activity